MGTTRKLAIKAFQETHPELKPKPVTRTCAPGQFLGMTVAFAASCITGASAQNGTNVTLGPPIIPDETGFGPTNSPVDNVGFGPLIASMSGGLLVVIASFVGYRIAMHFASNARVEPLRDAVVISNPVVQSPEVVLEMKAPAINPTTPVALTEKELTT